jgi:hypothetical protein
VELDWALFGTAARERAMSRLAERDAGRRLQIVAPQSYVVRLPWSGCRGRRAACQTA